MIMDKLCSKGGGSIKTIEIVEQPKPSQLKPQPQQPPQQKPKDADNAKASEKPKQSEKPKEEKPKDSEKPKQTEKAATNLGPAPAPMPKQSGPPQQAVPMMPQGQRAMYYGPYSDGYGGGVLNSYGMPPPPQPYECYGRPVYDSWGGGYQPPPPPPAYRPCHGNRCDYFSEENPQSCSIM